MLASFLYWLHVFGCPHAKTLVNLFLNTFCHLQPSKGHLTVWCALQCPPDYSRNTRTLLTSLASQITTHKYCQALSILFSNLSTISSFLYSLFSSKCHYLSPTWWGHRPYTSLSATSEQKPFKHFHLQIRSYHFPY